jgi:hypothetical protein
VPLADQAGELKSLRDEGKIGHIGLCNVTVEQLRAAQKIAPVASVQNKVLTRCYGCSSGLYKVCAGIVGLRISALDLLFSGYFSHWAVHALDQVGR